MSMYVCRDGVAVQVDLVTGVSTADSIVIESGLADEDQIITTWIPILKDGAAVSPPLWKPVSSAGEGPSRDSSEEQPQEALLLLQADGEGE